MGSFFRIEKRNVWKFEKIMIRFSSIWRWDIDREPTELFVYVGRCDPSSLASPKQYHKISTGGHFFKKHLLTHNFI